MNIVHSIIVTEYFEQITVSVVPVYDDKTNKTGDYISIREGETEFMFLPNELHDISHINFEFTDFSENEISIILNTNTADSTIVSRNVNKDGDFVNVANSNGVIKSIPTFVIRNVIDVYYFVEEQFDKIKATIDNKYNKLKVTV